MVYYQYKTGISQADQSLSLHHSTPAHQPGADSMYSLPLLGHEAKVEAKIPSSHSSLYAQEPVLGGLPLRRSDRAAAPAQVGWLVFFILVRVLVIKVVSGLFGSVLKNISTMIPNVIFIKKQKHFYVVFYFCSLYLYNFF